MKSYTALITELEAQLKIAKLEKELAELKAAAKAQPTKKSTSTRKPAQVCMAKLPTSAEPAQATPEVDVLTTCGSAYFASRAYDELIGGSENWKRAGSQGLRSKAYGRLDRAGKVRAAALVVEKNQKRLAANTIGLSGAEIVALAEAVAKLQ